MVSTLIQKVSSCWGLEAGRFELVAFDEHRIDPEGSLLNSWITEPTTVHVRLCQIVQLKIQVLGKRLELQKTIEFKASSCTDLLELWAKLGEESIDLSQHYLAFAASPQEPLLHLSQIRLAGISPEDLVIVSIPPTALSCISVNYQCKNRIIVYQLQLSLLLHSAETLAVLLSGRLSKEDAIQDLDPFTMFKGDILVPGQSLESYFMFDSCIVDACSMAFGKKENS
jgi:hypothetical protein